MSEREPLPPVSVDRLIPETPLIVRVDPPGGAPWVMTPDYARDMAALLIGAASACEAREER